MRPRRIRRVFFCASRRAFDRSACFRARTYRAMPKPHLNVALIGYQFMGKAHSNAYRQVGRFFDLPLEVRMKTICGRTEPAVKEAAEKMGWAGYETDWRKVL